MFDKMMDEKETLDFNTRRKKKEKKKILSVWEFFEFRKKKKKKIPKGIPSLPEVYIRFCNIFGYKPSLYFPKVMFCMRFIGQKR